MNSKKLYYLLVGLLLLLALGIVGAAYGSDMLFKQESKTLMQQKVTSSTLESKQKQLSKDKKDIERYTELNNISKAIVPKDKDTAQAVREIVNLARESNIPRLTSVTFPASTLGTKVIPTAGTKSSPSSSATNNLTQLTPVIGISSVYNLKITIQQADASAVPYDTFITFLEKLEQNRRTAQVSSITVTPNSKNPNLIAFTLVIDEYIKP